MHSIPVIDFSCLSIKTAEVDIKDLENQMKSKAQEILGALDSSGFFFLKNTGLNADEVQNLAEVTEQFFLQPEEHKRKFQRVSGQARLHGWIPVSQTLYKCLKQFKK